MKYPEPEDSEFIAFWRGYASDWARGLLSRNPNSWVILDTETTGATSTDEVVQVSIVDGSGKTLLGNWYVQPTCPIKKEAIDVHGITHTMLYGYGGFSMLYSRLCEVLKGKLLVCYNLNFDTRMLTQSALAVGLPTDFGFIFGQCAMEMYALWCGEWNPKYLSFRWQKLQGGDHSSLGDCLATYKVIKEMAYGDS